MVREDITKNKAGIKSLLKNKWLWALLIIVGLLTYCSRDKTITHIVLSDGITKIAIPPEIVKSKDCNKYHEWFHSHMTPLIIGSDRCPWTKKPKGPIGEFIINGEKFWIPRKYLWPDTQIPDGYHNDGMNLLMIYPDMTPPTGKQSEDERNREILVSLNSAYYFDQYRLKGRCDEAGYGTCDAAQHKYIHMTNFKRLSEEEKKIYPKNMGYVPDLDVTAYKHEPGTFESFYIRGDKYAPSYWLLCDDDPPHKDWSLGGCRSCLSCHSYFNWSDKLYIEYRFHRVNLVLYHDEIRQKITNKLKEFQQQPRG